MSRQYLQGLSIGIFESFDLHGNDLGLLLDKGYEPAILVRGEIDSWRHIYFVLCKAGGPVPSMVVSDVPSSFHSNGGGRQNINIFIRALVAKGIGPHIPCYSLSNKEWNQLGKGNLYDRRIAECGRLLNADIQDQFIERYEEGSHNFGL